MMIPLHNCWHCGKSLLDIQVADLPDVPFFHCDKICQSKCKRWNAISKDGVETLKSLNGQVIYVEDDPKGDPDFECTHKRNCKAHREICMAEQGYEKI